MYRDDDYLGYFFNRVLGCLFTGDAFSTVSDAQRWALIGELGLAGRLNSLTNGVDLVHTIPCGAEEDDYRHEERVLRGIDVDDDDFVVLWSGGFNTWTDVDTMFGALSVAMDRDPSIRFVATGGQIDGHDELTYPRFVDLIESSPHRDRFTLKGWIPRELVPNYYFEADVGINCEKDIYEVRLGSKHRILDWSRAALPVVTTRVTELSEAVEADGVGFVGRRFRRAMRRRYGFEVSTEALRRWAASPAAAPDRGRQATCLEELAGRVAHLQAAPAEDDAGPHPEDAAVAAHAGQVEEAPDGETRLQWLSRVVGKSYRDGGLGLIVKRTAGRLIGRRE